MCAMFTWELTQTQHTSIIHSLTDGHTSDPQSPDAQVPSFLGSLESYKIQKAHIYLWTSFAFDIHVNPKLDGLKYDRKWNIKIP